MNLKESFRYQKFLDKLLNEALCSFSESNHVFKTTKTHLCKKANPEADNRVEVVEVEPFVDNNTVLAFAQFLLRQKYILCRVIENTKSSIPDICIDAEVQANKFRQDISRTINSVLSYRTNSRTEAGYAYKFNAEGNQVRYAYDIETTYEDIFDRKEAKAIAKELIVEADNTSQAIDLAMVNTAVKYKAPFDVNDSFEDAVAEFTRVYLEKTEK